LNVTGKSYYLLNYLSTKVATASGSLNASF
jgi:hypothetical protein